MQKIINGCAIFSGIVSLTVVGLGGYLYLNKDSIIDKVKTEALKSVTGGLGGALPLSNPSSVDSPSPSLPSPF
tara:strand:+ start:445 stop:663 length:219 start_codon:yes stop_codon:yes gene_type:complete